MNLPSGKRVFSGIQPTGVPHIGNYLGAIQQWVALQQAKNDCFWFVADLHAITVPYDERKYRTSVLTTAATLFAAGIDPEQSVVFVQSHVPAHTEMTWYFQSLARMGELSRMTQFKEKSGGKESVSVGLFAYPVLQAVDILLYHTDLVPVGEDQVQHLEFARVLARRFNSMHGHLFTEPQPFVLTDVSRIMSLSDPTKKMSKSGDPAGTIFLMDTPEEIQKKVKQAVTDSGRVIDPDHIGPALGNLFRIHAAFSARPLQDVADAFKGKGYAVLKTALADLLVAQLTPLQRSIQEQLASEEALMATLQLGARRASHVAVKTLRDLKDRMGFTQIS